MKETRGTYGDLFGILFGSPTHLLISYEVIVFFFPSFFLFLDAAELNIVVGGI